ncbi:MAG: flagellar FlbD family protein [Sedimentisphaerales bacterium]|nr:flagellar FlbD family protein [Sedimentisphaerales bacterium]MBN2843035.1 flagellar FlbD family protein [Sedimentisphaerales bacterium]
MFVVHNYKGIGMVSLTRLNGKRFIVNVELIKFVESTPDTMITLLSGDRVIVKETLDEVVEKSLVYHRQVRSLAIMP